VTNPPRNPNRRLEVFDRLLRLVPTGRLVDLGAGHGTFSVRAADAGWDVTAVDARDTRFPEDPRVTWRKQDIREVELQSFDLILNLGLFYHLTVDDQVALLQRAAGRPMILDTHVATSRPTHELSDEVTVGGYRGRLYAEKGWVGRTTASWGNDESFWPTRSELYRMLRDHGYPVVLAAVPWVVRDRTFFLCLPE